MPTASAARPVTLITGAAGFVGSRLAKALLDRNGPADTILGIDNFDPYYDRSHKDRHLRDLLSNPRFTFIEADLRNPDHLLAIFKEHRPARVAHMAAMAAVRYSMNHPLIYGTVNVQGTMNLLDAARQTSSPACVLASTGSVYGTSTPVPFKEDAPADRPLAPYPASKRAMELLAHCYAHLWKLPTTIVRFFNVYGPHGRPDMMPWQWTLDILAGKPLTLYNAGHIKRDWTYIDDIVAGLILALDHPPQSGYDILNLGCSNPIENLRFVELLESLLNKKALIVNTPTPPTEPLITYAATTKAKQLLGYTPKTQIEQGLANFITWLREERII
ncbi:MAG TPA: NAD-dependent epimerase/dehydratase family protein [Phycisphaerae bacterium]|nr:NAD-dependent epimerase/dehydratase family protein [Phycisphaerae bacterium]